MRSFAVKDGEVSMKNGLKKVGFSFLVSFFSEKVTTAHHGRIYVRFNDRKAGVNTAAPYSLILGKQYYNELKRSIGLHSHGVGISSFVYLRRIIEKLVYNAFTSAVIPDLNSTVALSS